MSNVNFPQLHACSNVSYLNITQMLPYFQLKECNVHVYEKCMLGYKRISAFDHPVEPEHKPVVRVLYCGGVHYGEFCFGFCVIDVVVEYMIMLLYILYRRNTNLSLWLAELLSLIFS